MGALGNYVFGLRTGNVTEGFVVMASVNGKPSEQEIEYCPFCGTRLEEVNAMIIQKFTKPRLRRRKTKYDYQQ